MKLLIFKIPFTLPLFSLACAVAAVGCSTSKFEHQNTASEKASGLVQPENVYLAGLVIFPDKQLVISKHLGREVSPLWTPSTNIVVEALNQLPSYLLSTNKEPLAHPHYAEKCLPAKENLPKSICQVVGITFKGKKSVLLNFLPADRANGFGTDWRENFIKVYDGGPKWWSVIYLSEDKTFIALHFDLGY